MNKINFQRGSIVEPEFLNAIQWHQRFTEPNRSDYYSDENSFTWRINHRDGLKDWEIESTGTGAVSRLAHQGRILGHNGQFVTFGPPRSSIHPLVEGEIDSNELAPPGTKFVYIEEGVVQDKNGDIKSWPRISVPLPHGETYYLYFDPVSESPGYTKDLAPSVNKGYILLARVTLSPSGELSEYVDLRLGGYLGSLYTFGIKLINSQNIYSINSTLSSWERAFIDTSEGSLVIYPPENPQDGDKFAIMDITGSFGENPLILRPGEQMIHNTVEDWVINRSHDYLVLYYVEKFESWFFENYPIEEACDLKRGDFISCGGTLFDSVKPPDMCPNGEDMPEDVNLGLSLGMYSYDSENSRCYLFINHYHAVYSDGNSGYIFEPFAHRCGASRNQYKQWLNS